MNKEWRLAESNFTLKDKLKICQFILGSKNRWTQDKCVAEFENQFAEEVGVKHAIQVSSGSTANTLLAMYLKDNLMKQTGKDIVVLPAVTWSTSVSPWIREGFQPVFVDVSLEDLSMDLDKLEEILKAQAHQIACVFVTSLIGFVPNIKLIMELASQYKVKVMLDNCENTFGRFFFNDCDHNINKFFTSTTSCYIGHYINAIETGFIFTNSRTEYEYFNMARNHGMTRTLRHDVTADYRCYVNKKVDWRFDFYCLGNNFRTSDLHAFIGLLDFGRRGYYIQKRWELYSIFKESLNLDKYLLPKDFIDRFHVPFCLPIILKQDKNHTAQIFKSQILAYLDAQKIEFRPIISGFLGHQTAYKRYMKLENFPNAVFLHDHGLYVGLHNQVTRKQVVKLTEFLNSI